MARSRISSCSGLKFGFEQLRQIRRELLEPGVGDRVRLRLIAVDGGRAHVGVDRREEPGHQRRDIIKIKSVVSRTTPDSPDCVNRSHLYLPRSEPKPALRQCWSG